MVGEDAVVASKLASLATIGTDRLPARDLTSMYAARRGPTPGSPEACRPPSPRPPNQARATHRAAARRKPRAQTRPDPRAAAPRSDAPPPAGSPRGRGCRGREPQPRARVHLRHAAADPPGAERAQGGDDVADALRRQPLPRQLVGPSLHVRPGQPGHSGRPEGGQDALPEVPFVAPAGGGLVGAGASVHDGPERMPAMNWCAASRMVGPRCPERVPACSCASASTRQARASAKLADQGPFSRVPVALS